MAVGGLQHPSSQLMVKLFWIKVSCIWSHSLIWHSGLCFTALPGTEEDLVADMSVAEYKKKTKTNQKSNSFQCNKTFAGSVQHFVTFKAPFFILNCCHYQQKCYLVKQKTAEINNSRGKRGREKSFFKVVMCLT